MTAVLPALRQIKTDVEAQLAAPAASLDLTGLSLYQALVLCVAHPVHKGQNMAACWALMRSLQLEVRLSGVYLAGGLAVTVPVSRASPRWPRR
jgi:hypothetical protein